MAPDKIALQDLSAEAEADALLREEDERERGGAGSQHNSSDEAQFKNDLEELEASESLPPPVQATSAVSLRAATVQQERADPSPRRSRRSTRRPSSASGSSCLPPLSS